MRPAADAGDRDVGLFYRWAQTYDQGALPERFFRPTQAQTLALARWRTGTCQHLQ